MNGTTTNSTFTVQIVIVLYVFGSITAVAGLLLLLNVGLAFPVINRPVLPVDSIYILLSPWVLFLAAILLFGLASLLDFLKDRPRIRLEIKQMQEELAASMQRKSTEEEDRIEAENWYKWWGHIKEATGNRTGVYFILDSETGKWKKVTGERAMAIANFHESMGFQS